jgi:hypothetical protein
MKTAFATLLATSVTSLIGLVPFSVAHSAVDIGEASVISQQGQRLKVAITYASAPGERVPVTRFSVSDVSSESTGEVPKANQFTISQPATRNVLYLQSKEIVKIDKLKLTMVAADTPGKNVVFDLLVPPAKSAAQEVAPKAATKAKSSKSRKGTKAKSMKRRSAAK